LITGYAASENFSPDPLHFMRQRSEQTPIIRGITFGAAKKKKKKKKVNRQKSLPPSEISPLTLKKQVTFVAPNMSPLV
jgi:hypothetical protein